MAAEYRAYVLRRDGSIDTRHDLVSEDDQAAIKEMRQRFQGRPVELWSGRRLVARCSARGELQLDPKGPPSAALLSP